MTIMTVVFRIALIIFLVEGLIMLGFMFYDPFTREVSAVIDSLLLILISSPLISFLAIKPYVHAQTTEIIKAKNDAETANLAKSEFLASMSHELRTPLNAVLGFAQMLQYDPKHSLSAVQEEYVESIVSGGTHLLELVNDVLDLARIEANRAMLTMESVNAMDLCAECVDLTVPLGEARNVRVLNEYTNGPPSFLRTDRLRLKQILLNLLSNAVKYNEDNGTVVLTANQTDDGFLRLSVKDSGIGIAEKDFPNVFKVFHRLDSDPLITREGTGIGLAVTKMLVEQMAGRMGFESEFGVGSTFWVELPLTSNFDVMIWTDALQVGVDAIDKDHQVLIMLLNRLMYGKYGDADLNVVIDDLVEHIHRHFRREEAIMEICAYPGLEAHRQEHRDFIEVIDHLAFQWHQTPNLDTLRQIREFIQSLIFDDIMKVDAGITPYTKGKKQEIANALRSLT